MLVCLLSFRRSIFMPSLYIAVSHKTNTDDATCLIHPISMLNSPSNFSASISVMKAMAHLNTTVSNNISMPMAISFTSDIRTFQPLYQTYQFGRWLTKHYEVFEPCRSQGSLSRLDICKAKAAYPKIPFGIAFFDTERDFMPRPCPGLGLSVGNLSRTRTVRKLRDFLRDKFTDASKLQNCLAVQ
ncbi:hypothetical protein V5799_007978 [Amblyomma americanum]|uniref:Uncharacterized protein n=1 Tax=Amblyomma americanum TaxID=6943 RepID=A0AAQ4FEJ1_AMBAM